MIEGVAETAGYSTLSTHILETHPDIEMGKIRALRNQHWNAIKHFYAHDRKRERDDHELMATFSDDQNDMPLFMGWFDYVQVTGKLPIPVQVFQVWWYAIHEEKLANDVARMGINALFPGLRNRDRSEQKRRLRRAIERFKNRKELTQDPRTELTPLVFAR